MRVLFTPLPVGTHLYHQVALAWAFRAAGHEVRVAAQPVLTPTTISTGLLPVEVGDGYEFMAGMLALRSGNRFNADELAAMSPEEQRRLRDERFVPVVELASRMAPDMVRFAELWRPDLVITDPVVFAAPLIAAMFDIPVVRNIWGPDILYGHPLQGQPRNGDERDEWPTGLVELFDRYGAEVRNDYPVTTIDPWPAELQTFGLPGHLPRRYIPYNGAAAAPDWVVERPERPRVCVTWGTTTTMLGGDKALLPRVVDALVPLDLELAIAVTPADRRRLGPLPDNVRVAENLPINLLMPTCEAIVNQGGTGSVLTAASAGVPQVLMPEISETPVNSHSFGASGAAIVLDSAKADAEAITSAVTTALTDEAMRTAARKVRDEIAEMPSPAAVVGTLEDLAAA